MAAKNPFGRSLLHTSALIAVMSFYGQNAYANPTGGVVTSGSAGIVMSGATTTITQSTDRAIIRWNSFDVQSSERVDFVQPNSSSITVNRIRDSKPSSIDGTITANGNIVLINPNGVVFGSSSVVDVGGLVATSSDIEDDNDFMNGGAVKFTKPGNHESAIINNGHMTVREGGLIGLVAPNVENNGVIQARLGKVQLASGNIHTIDFAGDGLIKLEISDDVYNQSLKNTGTISADGGYILITAATGRNVVNSLITNSGAFQANTVTMPDGTQKTGSITISTHGLDVEMPLGSSKVVRPVPSRIENTGTINVDGNFIDQIAGKITILADQVMMGDGSVVSADGDSGGGDIRIGGDYQGGNNIPTSDKIFISEHVILSANARRRGDGGRIILWSDENTRFYGHAEAKGGIESGDGGFIEISGEKFLDFNGTVDLLSTDGQNGVLFLDPTDIVISSGSNSNVNGATPFAPTADDVVSILNITTLQTALASGSVIVQTRATGTQAGNITVSDAITWTNTNTLTLSAHNSITVDATISAGTGSLTMIAGGDIALNAAVSGTGTIRFQQATNTTTIGVGNLAVGTIHLNTTDLSNITNGWAGIVIGTTTGTGDIDLRAATWNDVLTVQSNTGIITVNGTQTMGGNALNLTTNADIVLNANLTGTGTLTVSQVTASTSIGLGNAQTGTINLDATELSRITNGWGDLIFGTTTATGGLNIGTTSWNDRLTLRTGSGAMNINGNISMAGNNLTFSTDSNISINGNLTGTGSLSFVGSANATTMGVGTGQAGTISFTDTELGRITNGWGGIFFGSTNMTGALNVGAYSWNDSLSLRTNTGLLSINGAQTMSANNLTLQSANLTVAANLSGTGTLSFVGRATSTTIGVGTGQAGTLQLTDAELNFIQDGWATLVFGATNMTAVLNIGGRMWLDSVDFRTSSGALNINGAQNMGANNLTIRTNTNLAITQVLAGTGTINILGSSAATTMGVGTGQAGSLQLSNAELANISNGWANIIFGSTGMTGAMNIGAYTWNDSVEYRTSSGVITISGAQNMGANNLVIRSDANLIVNAALTGTGALTLLPNSVATTMGVGTGQAGTFAFTDAELDNITNGWSSIFLGRTDMTGVMNIGARTWNDNLAVRTSTGVITLSGTQTLGANNLTISTNANLALNGDLSGTGILTILPVSTSTTIGIGTGQTGTLSLVDSELARILNGWSSLVFGRTDATGTVNVGAYTWNDNVTFQSGTGVLTITGTQTMGSNNLTLSTNSNLTINADLIGTGTLNIKASSGATTIGLGNSQTGTLGLSNAEIARFVDGWGQILIGDTGGLGAINIGANTWVNPMTFLTQGNVVLNGVQTSTETTGTSLVFATTNGSFINNAGASAINPGSGRYLVYSIDENNDTLGGIIRPGILTNQTYAGYGPSSVVEVGSQHLYSGIVTKILYLTIDDQIKIYGDADPVFTYTYVGGLVNGDLLSNIILGSNFSAVGSNILDNAGTTRIISGSFSLGSGYTSVVTNGTLTVTKSTLIAQADDENREYGLANPSFNIVYSGFKNGDDQTDIDTLATGSTTATATSNVGSYAIMGSGAVDNNYDFTYVNTGNLSVTRAMLTATTQNATREYGLANPAFTFVYTGFRNGETQAVIDTLATGSTTATATSNVGSYAITGSGAVDNNYDFTYVNTGNLSVTRAMLTATTQNATREFGQPNPMFNIIYTGFRNGETQAVIDTLATASTQATLESNVGTYVILGSGAVDNNYDFTYVNGNLNIIERLFVPQSTNTNNSITIPNTAINSISPKQINQFNYFDRDNDVNQFRTNKNLNIIFVNNDFVANSIQQDRFLIGITEDVRKYFYDVDRSIGN